MKIIIMQATCKQKNKITAEHYFQAACNANKKEEGKGVCT